MKKNSIKKQSWLNKLYNKLFKTPEEDRPKYSYIGRMKRLGEGFYTRAEIAARTARPTEQHTIAEIY